MFHKFNVGFTLFRPDQRLPEIILPELNLPGIEWLTEKPGSLSRLLSMLGLFNQITKFHTNPEKENITLMEFLKTVAIPEEYKEDIVLPILAASFILHMDKIREVGAIYAGGLMAAPGLIPSSEFFVTKLGMQHYIEELARKTQSPNHHFHLEQCGWT